MKTRLDLAPRYRGTIFDSLVNDGRDILISAWCSVVRPLTSPLTHDGAAHVQKVLACRSHAVIRAKTTPVGAMAVLAITGPDGQTFTRRFKSRAPGSNTQTLRLDALEFLSNRLGNPWCSIFIDDAAFRKELAAHRSSFPTFELVPAPNTETDAKANHALNGTHKPARTVTTEGPEAIIIATDASVAVNGTPGAGIAYAASDGTSHTRYLPGTADIGWAELNAIHDAVQASINHRHVNILSDNRHAVALAAGQKEGAHARDRALVAKIVALTVGRDVNIQWVRAHQGHPLNEAADTLATKTRHFNQRPAGHASSRRTGAPRAAAA